jgi:phage baseplate assembly protein V
MLARGVVALVDAAKKLQGLQVRLMAGEVKDGVEHAEPYGFTSNPHAGAEAFVGFIGGDRSHAVAFVVCDRAARLQGLQSGEVAIYTDEGDCLVLKRGRVAELTTGTFRVNASEGVEFNTPMVKASEQMQVAGAFAGQGGASFSGGGGKAVQIQGDAEVSGDLKAAGASVRHHEHQVNGNMTGEPLAA